MRVDAIAVRVANSPDMKHLRGMALVLVTLTLNGCGGDSEESSAAHDVTGAVIAPECAGGYDVESSQIVVRDQADDVIATGTTSPNLLGDVAEPCVVDFKIADVPAAEFYTVAVGTHSGPTWSRKELESQDWTPQLTLGEDAPEPLDPADFCVGLDALNTILFDTGILNQHFSQWNEAITRASDITQGLAVAEALDGEDAAAADLMELARAMLDLRRGEWANVKVLDEVADQVNRLANIATGEYCDEPWDEVSYS